MNLKQILSKVNQSYQIIGDSSRLEIIECDEINIDSRKVKENDIFFGLIGSKQDGAYFLQDVLNKGCRVAFLSRNTNFNYQEFLKNNPNFIIILGDVFSLLVEILNIFYPSLPQKIYAVTGTNGKTSVAEFARQILQLLKIKSASIGTLGIKTQAEIECVNSGLTTPDIVSLYQNLAILKANKIDDVAIEVSSIGLEQQRIGDIKIAVGAFTNFSQDHLDYHQNMENYFVSKMILFEDVVIKNGYAVLNADIPEFSRIKTFCQKQDLKIIDYGYGANSLKIIKIIPNIKNYANKVIFLYHSQEFSFVTNVSGDFQIYNILCALGMVLSQHNLVSSRLQNLLNDFDKLSCASGRMQKIAEFKGANIFVDFAHTPDALENVLKLARKISKNRIVVLFGCGGDRDSKKRPLMGEIACALADLVFVTDDNPRSEDPVKIRQEILQNCNNSKTFEIADRKIAIHKAIEVLQDGDALIVAGKGHEDYQIIGAKKFEFNEEKIIKNVIDELSKSTLQH